MLDQHEPKLNYFLSPAYSERRRNPFGGDGGTVPFVCFARRTTATLLHQRKPECCFWNSETSAHARYAGSYDVSVHQAPPISGRECPKAFAICPLKMNIDRKWLTRVTRYFRRHTFPVPLCPSQIPHGTIGDEPRPAVWDVARPLKLQPRINYGLKLKCYLTENIAHLSRRSMLNGSDK